MKNADFVIEQYRGGKLVRTFTPSGDPTLPWRMAANGKSYLRSHGWVLSKVLPTLMDASAITTKVIAASAADGLTGTSHGTTGGHRRIDD
ncbi:hypothetical protein ACS5PN_27230 [Roseateles sp. NT4]|uniref:hypothetical protein n=1 Tax=Roseateles sp. NT4 TaxID=3453715 RepID=UPI003EF015A1